jgi:hypothetical protein
VLLLTLLFSFSRILGHAFGRFAIHTVIICKLYIIACIVIVVTFCYYHHDEHMKNEWSEFFERVSRFLSAYNAFVGARFKTTSGLRIETQRLYLHRNFNRRSKSHVVPPLSTGIRSTCTDITFSLVSERTGSSTYPMDDTGPHEEPHQNGASHTDTDDGASRPAKQRQNSIDRDAQDMDDAGPHEETHRNGTSHTDTDDGASRPAKQRQNSIDRDAQDMVIDSLRAQIQDLISQVSELNNKLVKSYDRVSDLEDNLHVASANVRSSSVKISQLELERTQHLSALNTGLLVEKSHVTSELTRLMEKATEEAAQRGQAESARIAIEKDLDDLSATLFGQANSMVAEARYDKHLSERKVEEAERALKSAEEAVQLMQSQMQTMQTEKEEAEKNMRDMEQIMGKGKWVATRNGTPAATLRLMSMHAPYQEYLSFVAHLRVLHPTSPQPPAMTTLLQLPFLHRLLTEDS